MLKEIEEFSCLFDLTPNINILDLNSDAANITKALNDFVNPFDGTITTVRTSILNKLRSKIKRSNYDYGVICNIIASSSDKKSLMNIISMAIRDSGHIIILEKKDKELTDIYNLLEEFDYGALSTIDIFDKYNLIMGKKLHMWGMD